MRHAIKNCVLAAFISVVGLTFSASPDQKVPRFQQDLRLMRERRERAEQQQFLENVKVERDIVYGSELPQRQSLDIYVPKNADKPLPLVVWIHGGGWRAGDKRQSTAFCLLDDGFAVASINYRLTDSAIFPAQIHDCKAAIRWLRANAEKYKIDPNRIGVWGASAGGHLVALLGTTNGNKELEGTVGKYPKVSSDVQAVCDWFGPSDFLTIQIGKNSPEEKSLLLKLFGGTISEKRQLAESASPFHQADANDVPFLIMHGDADQLVPLQQSKVLHEKLKAAGVDSTLIIMEGKGHGFGPEPEVFEPIEKFFKRVLQQEKADK